MIEKARLEKILKTFRSQKILVIGDVMLDQFIWGKVGRISPEAPVPVVEVQSEEFFVGGAANVARNLRSLSASVAVMGRVGKDNEGKRLLSLLKKEKIKTTHILSTPQLPTIIKTRIIAKPQQVVRVDREVKEPLSEENLKQVRRLLRSTLAQIDAVIVEDYGKGFITQALVDELAKQCGKQKRLWTVDPNPQNPLKWSGAYAIKPNRQEAFSEANLPLSEKKGVLQKVGKTLLQKWKTQLLLITLGEQGMQLFEKNKSPHFSPTKAREVFDVSGAGDTAIAAFTLALVSGATPIEATEIANHAAGVVVGKLGTATASLKEIMESFQRG